MALCKPPNKFQRKPTHAHSGQDCQWAFNQFYQDHCMIPVSPERCLDSQTPVLEVVQYIAGLCVLP